MVGARGRRGTQQTEKPKFFLQIFGFIPIYWEQNQISHVNIEQSTFSQTQALKFLFILKLLELSIVVVRFIFSLEFVETYQISWIDTKSNLFMTAMFLSMYIERWHLPRVFLFLVLSNTLLVIWAKHQSSIDFQPFSEITKDEGQYHHGWPIKEVSLELA